MDLILSYLQRHRRRCLILLGVAAFGASAYKIYQLPSISRGRRRLARLLGSLAAAADATASSAEAVALVSSDLNRFLRSDFDEISSSLRQISKLARSEEVAGSLARVSEALTVGIVRGLRSSSNPGKPEHRTSPSFSDRLIEKLFSAEASGLASTVAGSFAKGLVVGFYQRGPETRGDTAGGSPSGCDWVELICDGRGRHMIVDCIQVFVSTAVAVYLDKTMDMNVFDDLFSGLTNPKHKGPAKDMLVSVCSGAVETLVTTSHRVLTSSSYSSSSNSAEEKVEELGKDEHLIAENARSSSAEHKEKDGGGWADQMKSTLAVPANRRFIVDVSGRIAFDTVRSLVDHALLQLYDGAKRGISAAREEVIECGFEVVRFCSAKSTVIITICLLLFMHIFTGTRVLTAA